VITAKFELTARLSLEGAGLTPDELFANVHGPEKAAVLASLGAAVYVGDTPPDMAAAARARAVAVGVTTGSFTERDLFAAGADVVLGSLTGFPAVYANLA
jgi:phosphoglycolate phosphatase